MRSNAASTTSIVRLITINSTHAAQIMLGGANLYGFTEAHFKKADAAAEKDRLRAPKS